MHNFPDASVDAKFFLDDGHQDVNRDGDPNLSADSILAGSVKCFDTQVLLDPFEEEFHLPASFVKLRDP